MESSIINIFHISICALKNNEDVKADPLLTDRVTMYEDLTFARRQLCKTVKELPNVEFFYTRDGALLCKMINGRFQKVENADDLFHLGVNKINYATYYPGLEASS